MEIASQKFILGNLSKGYQDDPQAGASCYEGQIDIRPEWQREYVYGPDKAAAVVQSVANSWPIGLLYLVEKECGDYAVLDGVQRITSLLRFVRGDYSVSINGEAPLQFHNQPTDIQDRIREYELDIYLCKGNPSERIAWFRTINTSGEPLRDQEMRNAIFAGPMVSAARRWFSKPNAPAHLRGGGYLRGSMIRQDYLETAIKWISDNDIEGWMGTHRSDEGAADALWSHFSRVIEWIERVFPKPRWKEMKGLDWGKYYRDHGHRTDLDPIALEAEISDLMGRDEITKKSGVYEFVLTRDERCLSIRAFTDEEKRAAWERQGGKCAISGNPYPIEEMQADHRIPFSMGGRTIPSNLRMVGVQEHRDRHAGGEPM